MGQATKEALEVFQNLPQQHKEALNSYEFLLVNGKVDLTLFTCADCPHVKDCEYAFDAYNTRGECLAMK